jgi:hypothetical protein
MQRAWNFRFFVIGIAFVFGIDLLWLYRFAGVNDVDVGRCAVLEIGPPWERMRTTAARALWSPGSKSSELDELLPYEKRELMIVVGLAALLACGLLLSCRTLVPLHRRFRLRTAMLALAVLALQANVMRTPWDFWEFRYLRGFTDTLQGFIWGEAPWF